MTSVVERLAGPGAVAAGTAVPERELRPVPPCGDAFVCGGPDLCGSGRARSRRRWHKRFAEAFRRRSGGGLRGALVTFGVSTIRAAAARLDGRIVRTPLLESPQLNELTGARVFVKAECLQLTGSFKIRGALNRALVCWTRSAPEAW